MNLLPFTFSSDATAKLILVKNRPMLLITLPDGKVITTYPRHSILLHFGLVKEHTDMLAWLKAESVVDELDRFERQFADAYRPFAIIAAPLLFEVFKPQSIKILDEKKPVSRRAS